MHDTSESTLEISMTHLEPPLDTASLFGRKAPLEVEIGCGKGLFLQTAAQSNPQRDFIAIEMATKYYKWTRRVIAGSAVSNVRLVREEAGYFIDRYLEPQSVTCFHMYYPDPWPKRRHHRRRLFNAEFLETLRTRLVVGGELRLATDFTEYHDVMCKVIDQATGWRREESDERWQNWLTNFKRKYEEENRPTHRECLVRVD